MKIISRYLLKNFFSPFLVGLCTFSLLFFIEQFFEKLDTFLVHKANLIHILEHLFLQLPDWIVQICPLVILLGILFSLSKLSLNNEIIALKTAGVGSYRFLSPLFFLVFICAFSVFLINEFLVPLSNTHARYTIQVKIEKLNPENKGVQEKFVLIGRERKFFTIDYFDAQKGIIRGIGIDQYNENFQLVKQIYAKEAVWKENRWSFYQGIIREFTPPLREGAGFIPNTATVEEEKFIEKTILLPEKIEDFFLSEKSSDEMSSRELKQYIKRLEARGIPARGERINLYLRFAYPFSNLIMFFLGVPFALSLHKGGRVRSFAFSLGIAFLYWGILSLSRALGENRYLSPVLSAWSANILFAVLGLSLFLKIKK